MSRKIFNLLFALTLIMGLAVTPAPQPARAAGPWYVSTTGNDANDCLSPATPCATINGALNKPDFVAGDTILVAIGTYTGTGNEVVLLDKDATLSGGWDETFTAQSGVSTIDGEGARRGVTVSSGTTTVEAFIIQNGSLFNTGGGILNIGTLTLNNSTVSGNSTDFGGGIANSGTLTLNNTAVNSNSATTFGGGILNSTGGILTLNNTTVSGNAAPGGGIANSGALTMNNSTVSDNSAPTGSAGGISNSGGDATLTLNNTTVSGNMAFSGGGGIFNSIGTVTLNNSLVTLNGSSAAASGPPAGGGGISNNNGGTVTLNDSTVNGNSAIFFGGGIFNNAGGTVTLNNSTVSNSVGFSGGGIFNYSILTLTNSTVNGNSATFVGGGLFNGISGGIGGTLTLNNTTVSGNSATSSGGGLYNAINTTGLLTLNYSTVTNNTSDSDNDGSGDGGGINNDQPGTATLQSSLVAGNTKGPGGLSDVTADCSGSGVMISQNYNLTGSGTGCSLGGAGDVTVTPANVFTDVLGVLADYGGPTQTHALIFGSANPALDAIPGGTNSCGSTPFDLDQRGVARPQGSACDIGAFELEQMASITGRVTDAVTGNPLPGDAPPFAVVELYRCDVTACSEFVNFQITDSQGRFQFTTDFSGSPLPSGTYQVQVSASQYQTTQVGPFSFVEGQDLDLGDIALSPLPAIIGRVVDAVTGTSLPGDALPFALVTLLRCDEFGCFEFVNQQQADSNGRFRFSNYHHGAPLPTGTYQLEVSAHLYQTKQVGPFNFDEGQDLDVGDIALTPPSVIRGRVVDADTGTPLPGDAPPFASVTLRRCDVSGCFDFVNSQIADSSGQFQFNSFFHGAALPGGTYELEIAAGPLYEIRRLEVVIGDGENRDLGDVLLAPLPRIGSISGQVIDSVTRKPVSAAFAPFVRLNRCNEFGCFNVNSQTLDSEGRFRFEFDSSGNPLVVGTYQIVASADQYEQGQTDLFDVGEGEHRVIDIRLKSFPVRFSDIRPCADLPATGGECIYSVKITNGLATELEGASWSIVDSSLPGSFAGFTIFQTREPRDIEIESGNSQVLQFRFRVPANNGPFGTSVCAQVYVGQGGRPLFNTVGQRHLFCVFRGATGFTVMTPAELQASIQQPQAAEPTRLLSVTLNEQAVTAANGTDTEPNDTCATAQDAGSVTLPFTLEGALDSTQSPDVDFFRFTGTPDALVMVDLEGQFTGKGTVSDPFLGFFDSNCNVITLDDDGGDGPNSRLQFNIPPDGVYILGVTVCCDSGFGGGGNGSYQLTITPVVFIGSISGRIVDSKSGEPLPGDAPPFAFARLLRCGDGGCSEVNNQNADSLGQFRFERDFNGNPLLAGTYQIQISANEYLPGQTDPFSVGEAEHLDLGNVPLAPKPTIGSISGRITDAVTGKALPGNATPFAFVDLLRCDEFGCFSVIYQLVGSDGRFRFDSDFNGAPLPTGNYLVAVSADQYQPGQTQPFFVGEDENRDIGDVPLQSFPVRFSDIQPCVVPSGGGMCEFSVKVTNGMSTRLSGKAWSIVDGSGLGSFTGFTRFQTSDPLDISLAAGGSRVVRFRFRVPGTVADGTTICTQAFVGQGRDALFNTVGQRFLFCFVKGSSGFTLMPEQESQTAWRELQTHEIALPAGRKR